MAREESSRQAKKRTKKKKVVIKAALKNICDKAVHITEQEEAKSRIFMYMREKQTLPYRGSRKGFAHIEDEIYKKEGHISNDKVRLRSWIEAYEKHGEAIEDDEIIKKAKEILHAPPSESSLTNSSCEEDALSKLLKKRNRRGRVVVKGAGACQTKLNAIRMTSSKGLDVEEHIDKEDRNKDDEEDSEEDSDEDDKEDSDEDDSDDEHNKDPKTPSNTSTTPQSQNGSSGCSRKCKLLNLRARNEVVAIGSWITDEPSTVVYFVPLGKYVSKVWIEEVLQPATPLFRPNSSMDTVGDAIGAPIAWPTDHILMLDN